MDQSAIKQIQQSNTVAAANEALEKQSNISPAIVIPENFKVHELQSNSPFIDHYKGDMNTDSLSDFSSFVEKFDQEGSICFINADNMRAKTFINLGTEKTPKKGDFIANLSLRKTSEYSALLGNNASARSQSELSEFIEDWQHCITCHKNNDDESLIDNKTAVKAIRSVTIRAEAKKTFEDQDFKAERSALESISCDTENGLPAIIRFTCIPYTELNERTFNLRVSIQTGKSEPTFKLRIVALEAAKEDMAQELMEKLKDKFSKLKTDTFIGGFQP